MQNQSSVNMSSDSVTINGPSISGNNKTTAFHMVSLHSRNAMNTTYQSTDSYELFEEKDRQPQTVTIVRDEFNELQGYDSGLTRVGMVSTIAKIEEKSPENNDIFRLKTRPPPSVSPTETIVKDELDELLCDDSAVNQTDMVSSTVKIEAKRPEASDIFRLKTRPPRNLSPTGTIVKDESDDLLSDVSVLTGADMVSTVVKVEEESLEACDIFRLKARPPPSVSPTETIVKDELDELLSDESAVNPTDMVSPIIEEEVPESYDIFRLKVPRNVSPTGTIVKDQFDELLSNDPMLPTADLVSTSTIIREPRRQKDSRFTDELYSFPSLISSENLVSEQASIGSQEPMDIDMPLNPDELTSPNEEKHPIRIPTGRNSFTGQSPSPEHRIRKRLRRRSKKSHKHGSDHRDKQETLSPKKRSYKSSRKDEKPSERNSIDYKTKVNEESTEEDGYRSPLPSTSKQNDEDSDYGWKYPAPPKVVEPKDQTKSIFESCIINEKLRDLNESLKSAFDLNHIEEQKKKLFRCIELTIAEESKKKLTELDKSIQKKKDDYTRNLFGTDNFDHWDDNPALSNVEISQKLKRYKSFIPAESPLMDKMTMKSAVNAARLTPIRQRNELVFHGQIKRIETEFQGQILPESLLTSIKEEKKIISSMVIDFMRPFYENGKIQPKSLFKDVVKKICHVFYEEPADEYIVKTYIQNLFKKNKAITNLEFEI